MIFKPHGSQTDTLSVNQTNHVFQLITSLNRPQMTLMCEWYKEVWLMTNSEGFQNLSVDTYSRDMVSKLMHFIPALILD